MNTSKSAVAELMRVAWRTVGGICERVADLAAHFTFSLQDLRWVRSHRGAVERIGLAVQPGTNAAGMMHMIATMPVDSDER